MKTRHDPIILPSGYIRIRPSGGRGIISWNPLGSFNTTAISNQIAIKEGTDVVTLVDPSILPIQGSEEDYIHIRLRNLSLSGHANISCKEPYETSGWGAFGAAGGAGVYLRLDDEDGFVYHWIGSVTTDIAATVNYGKITCGYTYVTKYRPLTAVSMWWQCSTYSCSPSLHDADLQMTASADLEYAIIPVLVV